jgi:hypothetical protein
MDSHCHEPKHNLQLRTYLCAFERLREDQLFHFVREVMISDKEKGLFLAMVSQTFKFYFFTFNIKGSFHR